MTTQQQNITIGTAGHIDHGKTALIRLLTGCETDRLRIEKERGMSIELGFAPCTIADTEIGIVDVPGHENFIKTMVAGASGIDGSILVVAADDGVMPQTREHLDILTLLGVRHGIVALTKIDTVPPERVEAVAQEIRAFLVGTFLQDAPILPVSSITGDGFEAFYEALKAMVGGITPKPAGGVFRVPVERAFTAKGYGTVVAGIPTSGSVAIGDEVVLLPPGTKGRIRAVQVYGRDSDRAMAGQCAALNVPQWEHKTVERGQVVTVSQFFAPYQWYLCDLKLLDLEKGEFKNASRVKFHTGTSETAASVYLFQQEHLKPGGRCLVQVRLNDPVVAGPRDPFILRSLSPTRTIGGGIVIEPLHRRLKGTNPDVLADIAERARAVADPKTFIEYCIRSAESLAAGEKEISLRSKVPPNELGGILQTLVAESRVLPLGSKLYIHADTARRIETQLLHAVGAFHQRHPESPGIARDHLLAELAIRKEVFDSLVERMRSEGRLAERKGFLALPQHREQFNEVEQQLLDRVDAAFRSHPFDPPDPEALPGQLRVTPAEVQRALRILMEQQRLIRIDRKLLFHAQAVADARERLVNYVRENGGLESVKFKYLLDTSRKYAIPLLDYFDKIGLTRRAGYTRHLR